MISKKIILLFLIVFNSVKAQNNDFSLSGKTAEIEDGTYLYFRDLVNGGDIDSAVVRNNRFRFTTDLPEPTLYVMLFTKDKQKFTELWLENNKMTFDASNVDFKEAKVTGSRNHSLVRKLKEELYGDDQISEKDKFQVELEFIKNHPDVLVSAYLLFANKRWEQHEVGDVFPTLSDEIQNSSLGQRIVEYLEKDLPQLGENYADFSISNSKGELTKISDLKSKGKLTLLQFWYSGCSFSRANNANLAELYNKHHSEGFEIISISEDTKREKWIRAMNEDEFSWPVDNNLIDLNGEVFSAYGIYSIPSNFLINREGIIIARNLRGDELERKIEGELAE